MSRGIIQVILLDNVINVGKIGAQVAVKSGYARNFLIPRGRAIAATTKNIAYFEEKRADLEKESALALEQAQQRAEKLATLTVTITARAGEEGKLFGSIGNRDIAAAVTAMGVPLERREVELSAGPIREVGEFEVRVRLHGEATAAIKLIVKAE